MRDQHVHITEAGLIEGETFSEAQKQKLKIHMWKRVTVMCTWPLHLPHTEQTMFTQQVCLKLF